jgi:replicative DNA helicase
MDMKIGAERVVIGTLLVDAHKEITPHLMETLTAEDFDDPKLKQAFATAAKLYNKNTLIDIIAISDAGGGEIDELAALTDDGFIQNARHHAQIVKTQSTIRKARKLAESIVTGIQSIPFQSPDEVKEYIAAKLVVDVQRTSKRNEKISDIVGEVFDQLDADRLDNDKPMMFGMRDLDWNTGGIRKSEVTIVAAGPGIGKTAFAMNIGVNVAGSGKSVLLVSREMNRIQVAKRIISNLASIDAETIRDGRGMNADVWAEMAGILGTVNKMPMYIDDTSTSVQEICNKCRRLKETGGVNLLIIDYLQLLVSTGSHESRRHEIEHISRQLKLLSLELELPIIALSQLTREGRKNGCPKLTDLRESGALEQDADNVIFLYDAAEYDNRSKPVIPIEVIVAKQRNGRTGTANMVFIKKFQRFAGVER